MGVPRPVPLILIPLAVAVGVVVLMRSMHRMRPRAQFLVLLVLGVIIGFTFLVMVQLPQFPPWLGVSLMRSLTQEDEQTNETQDNTK